MNQILRTRPSHASGAVEMTQPLPSFPETLGAVPVDAVGVAERVASIRSRTLDEAARRAGLRLVVSMIDLTTLSGADTPGKVLALCQKAVDPAPELGAPPVAAVCVYPPFVAGARRALEGQPVRVASVATAFPAGQASLDVRLDEVRQVVGDGAHEVDMVIARGAFLCGEVARVHDEIASVRELCDGVTLKVILETGELESLDNVRRASDVAIAAGADFIKTSTGKVSPAATLPVTVAMLDAIAAHTRAGGRPVGMKPAGGIRSADEALTWLVAVNEILGDAWLTPSLFRFGASSLLGEVLVALHRLERGTEPARGQFSIMGAY
jgi:deoxyribose-phosphate aldolase